jgi:hypothetical protein
MLGLGETNRIRGFRPRTKPLHWKKKFSDLVAFCSRCAPVLLVMENCKPKNGGLDINTMVEYNTNVLTGTEYIAFFANALCLFKH